MIGTKEFVDRMRSTYMPDNFHNEIPQHRALGKSVDPEKVLEKAAGILNCDLDYIQNSRRIPKLIKEDRDLMVYLVWKICILSNEETGRLFGMTYSAINNILSSMRTRMQKDSDLRVKYNNIYSLCKMRHQNFSTSLIMRLLFPSSVLQYSIITSHSLGFIGG
jgi:chromosomal replication initiation ATPase DnaA